MIKQITASQTKWVEDTLNSMDRRQKIAHVLCPKFFPNEQGFEELKRTLDKYPVGCAFFLPGPADLISQMTDYVKANSDTPVINAMDIIWGAGHVIHQQCTTFVTPMACGAVDDTDLTYEMGKATALEGRAHGIHWTLGPVADINININSPIVNFRAYADNKDTVIRHSNAFIAGVQDTSLMAATAKHFPGDGVDDRDQHLLTTINSLSLENWMDSFGAVYKAVIEQGVQAIMPGHIALPAVAPGDSRVPGPPPATLSRKLLLDLLRAELGFEGVIISDAINMTGLMSHTSYEKRGGQLINAGNDVILFADPELEYPSVETALLRGELSEEQLEASVRRILELKCRVEMLDTPQNYPLRDEEKQYHCQVADDLARKSIRIVRDENNILPLKLPRGARVLTVTVQFDRNDGKFIFLDSIDAELTKRGLQVDNIKNPPRYKLLELHQDYDAVFVNINIGPHARAGVLKLNAHLMGPFEDIAMGLSCPAVVTSFGDPFKIYEMPFLRTYVNTFSPTIPSQVNAVKLWLGEIEQGQHNPVTLKGFL